jgi:uncharacterized protein YhbP (UPF0306 family)
VAHSSAIIGQLSINNKMSTPLTSQEFETVRTFLNAQSTLSLATVNADGTPQIAPLFYVSDEHLNLYWLSSARSRHSINLTERPSVAVTIYPEVWEWQQIRGLQIEGRAVAVENEERQQALARYRDKFTLPSAFDSQIAASNFYQLTPRWLRWLDNSVKFGYKAEVEF